MKSRLVAILIVLASIVSVSACSNSPTQPSGNAPVIASFFAEPQSLTFLGIGQVATLRWEVVDNDAQVRIDPLPGNVPPTGSYIFAPTSIGVFNFTLTARNANGSTQRFISIRVQ